MLSGVIVFKDLDWCHKNNSFDIQNIHKLFNGSITEWLNDLTSSAGDGGKVAWLPNSMTGFLALLTSSTHL